MEFRLLGPVEALRDGSVVPIGGAKPRALLALLLLRANEVVPRDELVEALWPERPPGASAHSLDVQVSRLERRAYLTPAEQRMMTDMKKEKLWAKDQIASLRRP